MNIKCRHWKILELMLWSFWPHYIDIGDKLLLRNEHIYGCSTVITNPKKLILLLLEESVDVLMILSVKVHIYSEETMINK